MPLSDEHPGMMDRLCHTSLEHKCLETALKKVLYGQGQDVIELILRLIQKPIAVHPSEKSFTLKDTTLILFIKGKKHSRGITDTAQSILNPPQFSLAPKPVFSHKLQLSIQSLLLIGTTGFLKCLPIYYL